MTDRLLKIVVAVLAIVSLLFRLGLIELRAEEPRRAAVSIEMMESSNYVSPKLAGYSYYNKPPGFNWIQIAFYKIFQNKDEFTSRLPGVLSLLMCSVLIFIFLSQVQLRNIAFYAAAIFLSFADLLFYGSVNAGEIDLFFTLLVAMQVFTLYKGMKEDSWILYIISYLILALSFLTKGAPAFYFQALAALSFLITSRTLSFRTVLKHSVGLVCSVAVLSTYYFALEAETGEVRCYLSNLITESSQRSAAGFSGMEIAKNALIFPVNLLKLLLPWSLLIPFCFTKYGRKITANPVIRFAILFTLLSLPVFWLTGEIRNRYLYPVFPFVAIFFAQTVELMRARLSSLKSLRFFYSLVLIVMGLASIISLFRFESLIHDSWAVLLFAGLCTILFFLSFKTKQFEFQYLLIGLFSLKLLYMYAIAPNQAGTRLAQDSYYNQTLELLEQAESKAISLDLQPLFFQTSSCSLKTAPAMPYQYLYYHYIISGEVLQQDFQREYNMLSADDLVDDELDGYFFTDKQGHKYALVKDY